MDGLVLAWFMNSEKIVNKSEFIFKMVGEIADKVAHWDFLPKFISLHYYTPLESVLGVQRSGQAHGTIICLFGLLFFNQNGMTFKKATKIIKIH